MGNILSVRRALEHCGASPIVSGDPVAASTADRLVLPGVGAFGDGMKELRKRGLIEALYTFAKNERPLLGICLGMQMMLDESSEFGGHVGLGLIPGKVEPIPLVGSDGTPHKVPHMSWNALHPTVEWKDSILDGIAPGTFAYFVHSFAATPLRTSDCLAQTFYDGLPLTAVLSVGLLMGCQFHPEKSGPAGLKILSNFLRL